MEQGIRTQRPGGYLIGFAIAGLMVIVISFAAYMRLLPTWIAPGDTDKFFHAAMGGTLAFLLDAALKRRRAWQSSFAPPLSSVLVLVPLGIDEYFQRFSSVRSSSIWDFLADVVGVVVVTFVARRYVFTSLARGERR